MGDLRCMWKGCQSEATVVVDDDLLLCDKHYDRASVLADFESGFSFGLFAGMAANLTHRDPPVDG